MNLIPLVNLTSGQTSTVHNIIGGKGTINRLSALGIIPGKKITKISAMMMRGPVVVRVGRTQIALGFGMARKIIVDSRQSTIDRKQTA